MTHEEAYQRLELPEGTDIQAVRRQFATLHNDYRMRIDNAPTPRLRQLFQQQLEQAKEAYSLLNGSEGINDTIDLPRTRRMIYEDAVPGGKEQGGAPEPPAQRSLPEAYDYFGLSPEDDKVTFNRLVDTKLSELKSGLRSQSLPMAQKLYEAELGKAERLKALLVSERQEKEALAGRIAEKRAQERLAQEKAEQERLALERAERERVEKERLEKAAKEQDRLAREKAEQKRLALERAERERAEKERIEKASKEQERLAREKAEQERRAKEKAERLAREKAEKGRSGNEKAGKEEKKATRASGERAASTTEPLPQKSKKTTLAVIAGLLVVVIGASAFYFLTPGQESEPVVIEQNGLFGYKEGDGIVIVPRFESAEAFKEGKARVSVNDSMFYIDETGKLLQLIEVKNNTAEAERQKLDEKDRTAWEIAAASGSKAAYESYLKLYPGGQYVAEAKVKIAALEKQEAAEKQKAAAEKRSNARIDIAQYNKDLSWAKKMVAVDGCEGCRANPVCKSQVISRLKKALESNPGGREAKSLLNCLR